MFLGKVKIEMFLCRFPRYCIYTVVPRIYVYNLNTTTTFTTAAAI